MEKMLVKVLVLGVLTVSGCRSPADSSACDYMFERNADGVTITGYKKTPTKIVIPPFIQGLWVTCIGDCAFYAWATLTRTTIPVGVTNIGAHAFQECGLTSIEIPDGVKSIGAGAFQECRLTRVVFPSSVEQIDDCAFDCQPLSIAWFRCDAPRAQEWAFGRPPNPMQCYNQPSVTIYHLPNAAGWSTNFCGRPTAVWKPEEKRGK